MKNKSVFVKCIIFVLIGSLLFELFQTVFVEKTSYGKYRGWKAAEDVDILILGNSHADSGIRAADISTGLNRPGGGKISTFNYAIYGMRMEQMLFFTKEILKTHMPKLVILETYVFCPLADEHREILARRAFDVLPLNLNKIEAVNYCVKDNPVSFYFPLIKYHTRWKELEPLDVQMLYDEKSWSITGGNGIWSDDICENPGDDWFQQKQPILSEMREITPTEKECLEEFLALLEEKEIQLLFVSVPFKIQMGLDSVEQIKINNYLRDRYVNDDTVQMLDMNRMWHELEFDYEDLSDEGHVNKLGADKVTSCLLEYLRQHYNADVFSE